MPPANVATITQVSATCPGGNSRVDVTVNMGLFTGNLIVQAQQNSDTFTAGYDNVSGNYFFLGLTNGTWSISIGDGNEVHDDENVLVACAGASTNADLGFYWIAPSPAPSGGYRIKYRVKDSGNAYTEVINPTISYNVGVSYVGAKPIYEGTVESICDDGIGGVMYSTPVPFETLP